MALALTSGLYVSCQATPDSPLHGAEMMARFARCAVLGGASGIRAEGVDDVRAVKLAVSTPVIGLIKRPGEPVYITPSVEDAIAIAEAGADVVAVDATLRPRHDGKGPADFLAAVRSRISVPILADVDSVEAAVQAERSGAAFVATTLAGYTGGSRPERPDLDLLASIVAAVGIPVVAEGRYQTPEQVAQAFEVGAFAVVVGSAITDPIATTRRFVAATTASTHVG